MTPTPRSRPCERARAETDDLQGSVQGIGGDVWSWVPVAGGPVRDVRRLGNALDQLVAVAETGVRILPQVRGEESTLVDDGNVDIDVLEDVIDDLRGVSTRLADAQAELADVADSRAVVGDRLAEARDQAQGEVDPLADGLETIDPLLDQLPKVLGRDAEPAVPRGAAQPRRDALLRRHPADVRARRPRPAAGCRWARRSTCRPPPARPSPATGGRSAATRSTAGR